MEKGIQKKTATTTAIVFFVYILVITMGGATQCLCGDENAHDSRHACCSKHAFESPYIPDTGVFLHQNIPGDPACETCVFLDMSSQAYERIDTIQGPRERSQGSNTALPLTNISSNTHIHHNGLPGISTSQGVHATFSTTVLLI